LPDSSATILEPLLDGSFRLTQGGAIVLTAERTSDGFSVAGNGIDGWRLEEARAGGYGYVLVGNASGADGGGEIARTSRTGAGVGAVWAILEDGRLFEFRVVGLSPVRVDLLSDEAPGPYWTARRGTRHWTIEASAAGSALRCGPDLWILFAAEIVRWHRKERPRHG